ncbi:hypothetical protein CKAN_01738200 [Cinnamomum micranthum f. kanehirae]|uniref:Uncharacterized protein n=1 Tax=Cinnamomum micranthum f. kanehirae TaxID=337451 RepID=A0A3S3QR78_9MAGN|nr:hypothetical protein CKAN_01738200 [Cinnamomum micranthum f. kanehirae]
MQSYVDDHVDLVGWLEWDRDFALKSGSNGLVTCDHRCKSGEEVYSVRADTRHDMVRVYWSELH